MLAPVLVLLLAAPSDLPRVEYSLRLLAERVPPGDPVRVEIRARNTGLHPVLRVPLFGTLRVETARGFEIPDSSPEHLMRADPLPLSLRKEWLYPGEEIREEREIPARAFGSAASAGLVRFQIGVRRAWGIEEFSDPLCVEFTGTVPAPDPAGPIRLPKAKGVPEPGPRGSPAALRLEIEAEPWAPGAGLLLTVRLRNGGSVPFRARGEPGKRDLLVLDRARGEGKPVAARYWDPFSRIEGEGIPPGASLVYHVVVRPSEPHDGSVCAELQLPGGETLRSAARAVPPAPRRPTPEEGAFWRVIEEGPRSSLPGVAFLRRPQAEEALSLAPPGWMRRWAQRMLSARLGGELFTKIEPDPAGALAMWDRARDLAVEGSDGEPACVDDLHDGDATLFSAFYSAFLLDPAGEWLHPELPRRAVWMRYLDRTP